MREKRLDFGRSRRNAYKVEEDSPQQGWLVGVGDRGQPLRLKFGENESIDFRARPRIVFHSRRRRLGDRSQRPMRAARVEIGSDGTGGRAIDSGIGCSHPDPFFEHDDFRIRQLPLGRHFERLIANRFDQQTCVRRTGDDRRTTVASLHPSAAAVEVQPTLEDFRLRRVTLVTMFDKQRAHLLFEKLLRSGLIAAASFARGAVSAPSATEAGPIAPLPHSDSITVKTAGRKLIMVGLDRQQVTIDQIRRAEVLSIDSLQSYRVEHQNAINS